MEMKQKGDEGGRVVGAEAKPPKMVVANPGEEVVAVAEPWLKPKNNESLIPPKRRLVKRMMFERIAQFAASLFGVQGGPSSSEAPFPQQGQWVLEDEHTTQPQGTEE